MPFVAEENPTVILERADRAHDVALRRLRGHVQGERVKALGADRADLNFWVWRWVAEALGAAIAVLEAAGWLKDDWGELTDYDCWLVKPDTADEVPAEPEKLTESLVGAYVYWREFNGGYAIVRAGMACGEHANPMFRRREEHRKGADLVKADPLESLFYTSYPTVAALGAGRALEQGWRGTHECLTMSVLFGMDRDDLGAWIDRSSEGFLPWPAYFITGLGRVMRGTTSLEMKQARSVCYLFELAGELLLDPSANVSLSPGFEQLLQTFKPAAAAAQWPYPADE